eukprot:augustus_masked-scaffold_14-processed-gene-10.0-mRNA-1 protein AED:0.02 eAED:0.03 QI:0/-1/0/1/-1/1/1/0/225
MKIGVLALQGAFREHINVLKSLNTEKQLDVVEVRLPEELVDLDGLIIPGGESTAISLLATKYNFLDVLNTWTKSNKPTWGTCAGMILLAKAVTGKKKDGQISFNAMDITVSRNFFGSQLGSFVETLVDEGGQEFKGVFIRAPVCLDYSKDKVKVLAKINKPTLEKLKQKGSCEFLEYQGKSVNSVAVALQQDNFLATSFHPELTKDTRWHKYFVDMVSKASSCTS